MGTDRMSTLYIGNLPWSATNEDLSGFLSGYGEIVSCDTGSVRNGRSRGWAIVECPSADAAEAMIANCNGAELDGCALAVRLDNKEAKSAGGGKGARRAPRADRGGGDPSLVDKPENSSGLQVVVRNLAWGVTNEMLRGTFEQIGTVADATVISHEDSGRSKGWGTVRFTTAAHAADAIARFGGVELAERPMTVMMDRYN